MPSWQPCLKALTFALQSNQTDYNVHSVVAFFSFTINERDESVDSLVSAFLTPSQAPATATWKQRVRSVENYLIKLTLKSQKRTLVWCMLLQLLTLSYIGKSKTSPVLASLFHDIEIQDTKKKTRVQVQSETYESESSKAGLESGALDPKLI